MSVSINHHREGAGQPLVLLHGVGHHWQAWRPVIGLLAGEFDVIACDSPGFGRSPPLPAGIEPTIPAYADAFEWFFAELGLERPHVAGNSMGGAIALELARRRAVQLAPRAFSPAGFWTAAERRFCQLSLRRARAACRRAARRRWSKRSRARAPGASRCSRRPSATRRACPPRRPSRRCATRGPRPRFGPALAAFDHYRFERAASSCAACPSRSPGASATGCCPTACRRHARARMLPWATHVIARRRPRPVLRRPAAVAEVIRTCARSAAPDGAPPPTPERPSARPAQTRAPRARRARPRRTSLRAAQQRAAQLGLDAGCRRSLISTSRMSGPPKEMLETNSRGQLDELVQRAVGVEARDAAGLAERDPHAALGVDAPGRPRSPRVRGRTRAPGRRRAATASTQPAGVVADVDGLAVRRDADAVRPQRPPR